jgi:hypothetical protein
MEERVIKRLLIILAVSIIAILLIKVALTNTYSNLNDAAIAKKQAAEAAKVSTQEPAPASEVIDTQPTSGVGETVTVEIPAASGVSEAR